MKCSDECLREGKGCDFIRVGLVGNPNSGKSTIFNEITGEKQHIANYPGVTVEVKQGCFDVGERFVRIADLPGVYSLSASSEDELVTRNLILNEQPDVLVNVLDSTCLRRQLYLTIQLLELNIPMIVVLNKTDEADEQHISINTADLEKKLGVKIIRTVGTQKKGLEIIGQTIIDVHDKKKADFRIDYSEIVEKDIEQLQKMITGLNDEDISNERWLAVKLLENDSEIIDEFKARGYTEIVETAKCCQSTLSKHFQLNATQVLINKRFEAVHKIAGEYVFCKQEKKRTRSDKIDHILTNPFIGIPFFLGVMWLLFQFTFVVGSPIVGWIETLVEYLQSSIDATFADGWFKSLVNDGIISGVGAVFVFLPNIALLFFGIAILEYSGYISRAALIMDRMMQRIGLQGKSFIPMIIGFGCSIPALMATRVMDNRRDKLLTMLIIPFMSCGAKLPVYLILAGAFFPENAGTVIFSIYLFGILVGILAALLLRKTMIRGRSIPFILEMPKYQFPSPRKVLTQTGYRSWLYIRKIGTVILAASIILWFVMSYPGISDSDKAKYEQKIADAASKINDFEKENPLILNEYSSALIGNYQELKEEQAQLESTLETLENEMLKIDTENTIGAYIGKGIGTIVTPNGFGSWQVGTALFSGIAAKEIILSSLSTTYSLGQETDEESSKLKEALRRDSKLSNLSVVALLVFILLYTPCFGSIITFKVESKSWGWTIFMIFFTFAVAWIMSFLVYQIGSLLF